MSKNEIDKLIALYKEGHFLKVVKKAQRLTKQHPKEFEVWNILGAAAAQINFSKVAVMAFKTVIKLRPDYKDSYNNLGNVLRSQGNLEEAVKNYKKAISLEPKYEQALNNLGTTYRDQNRPKEALVSFKRALDINPSYASAYNNIGVIHQDQNNVNEAIKFYKKAIFYNPNFASAYNNFGNALKEQGLFNKSLEAYEKAISLQPNLVDAWSNGAELLEKWNKIEELNAWLNQAFHTLKIIHPDIHYYQAKLLWREKKFVLALEKLRSIDLEKITHSRKQDYLHVKGKCYEVLGNYNEAFKCFAKMNDQAKNNNDLSKYESKGYLTNAKDQLQALKYAATSKINKSVTQKTDFSPTFLVGFPRSGTTLLDTILRSHSSIDVVEEKPTLTQAKKYIMNKGFEGNFINPLPHELIHEAREIYYQEFCKYVTNVNSNSKYIDKLPLNLLSPPLIQQLYPEATYILAIRHPMDCILSCWIQNFELNSAMVNMLELEKIVDLYCVAMETFKICKSKYSLNVHTIKYENLLDNISDETSDLLTFLKLNWEPKMLSYQDTAIARGNIATPSYAQVVEPIYKHARYRWLKYESHLSKHLEKIDPWVKEFGY